MPCAVSRCTRCARAAAAAECVTSRQAAPASRTCVCSTASTRFGGFGVEVAGRFVGQDQCGACTPHVRSPRAAVARPTAAPAGARPGRPVRRHRAWRHARVVGRRSRRSGRLTFSATVRCAARGRPGRRSQLSSPQRAQRRRRGWRVGAFDDDAAAVGTGPAPRCSSAASTCRPDSPSSARRTRAWRAPAIRVEDGRLASACPGLQHATSQSAMMARGPACLACYRDRQVCSRENKHGIRDRSFGRVAFVTGASSGLGSQSPRPGGLAPASCWRARASSGEELRAEIEAAGGTRTWWAWTSRPGASAPPVAHAETEMGASTTSSQLGVSTTQSSPT